MKDLLAYHQRLVKEKGLPPSRFMEQHAAASASSNQSPGRKEKSVKCDQQAWKFCIFWERCSEPKKIQEPKKTKKKEMKRGERERKEKRGERE